MVTNIVDARGLACPQPVILTKKALESVNNEIITIVDNITALENVQKLARNRGYKVEVEDKDGEYHIHIKKTYGGLITSQQEVEDSVVFLITSNLLGKGEEELGQVLMRSFFYTLENLEVTIVKTLIFINSGVFLTTEGSPVIEHIISMENNGVEVISCGTCLDYYGLKDKLRAGRISNMYSIVDIITSAKKTITI